MCVTCQVTTLTHTPTHTHTHTHIHTHTHTKQLLSDLSSTAKGMLSTSAFSEVCASVSLCVLYACSRAHTHTKPRSAPLSLSAFFSEVCAAVSLCVAAVSLCVLQRTRARAHTHTHTRTHSVFSSAHTHTHTNTRVCVWCE
jgi:hypothetical protein